MNIVWAVAFNTKAGPIRTSVEIQNRVTKAQTS